MKNVQVSIAGKINHTLRVQPLEKGAVYHQLESLVNSINLYNTVRISASAKTVINYDYGQTILAAVQLMKSRFAVGDITLDVVRQDIPPLAGLGGSSSLVVATIIGIAKLYQIDCTANAEELLVVADKLGSDTRYMMRGGRARMSGRGDKVEWLAPEGDTKLLVITGIQSSTKDVFGHFDSLRQEPLESIERTNNLYRSANILSGGRIEQLKKFMDKSLDGSIGEVSMSGSGGTLFAPIHSLDSTRLNPFVEQLAREFRECNAHICSTVSEGGVIVE